MLHNVTMLSSRPPSVVCPKFRCPKDHNNSPPPFKVQVKKAYISHSMCFWSVCALHLHCVSVFRCATLPFTTFRFRALHPPQHLAAQDSAYLHYTTSLLFHFAPRMLSYSSARLQPLQLFQSCNILSIILPKHPKIAHSISAHPFRSMSQTFVLRSFHQSGYASLPSDFLPRINILRLATILLFIKFLFSIIVIENKNCNAIKKAKYQNKKTKKEKQDNRGRMVSTKKIKRIAKVGEQESAVKVKPYGFCQKNLHPKRVVFLLPKTLTALSRTPV